jgi:hypothetical protein
MIKGRWDSMMAVLPLLGCIASNKQIIAISWKKMVYEYIPTKKKIKILFC